MTYAVSAAVWLVMVCIGVTESSRLLTWLAGVAALLSAAVVVV
jgi:hypothetical protein